MKKGQLIILSGPSGVGKGTIRKELFKYKELDLHYSISMTTRSPRVGEVDGEDYFFVSKEEFIDKINHDGFLEYAQFVDNYYGTPKDYVDNLLEEGHNVLLEIEVQGALQVMKKRPDALSIFLLPPSLEELEKRIRGRGTEEDSVVKKRLKQALEELQTKDQYQYQVINNTIEEATLNIKNIIQQH